MEFINVAATQNYTGGLVSFGATHWGAELDPEYEGPGWKFRLRTEVADAGSLPVAGIGWRDAARFCNWLTNGKVNDTATFENGAYNTSTFVDLAGGTFADQREHNSGATFWIPTLDEWLKAAHYDPNRYGQEMGGYWLYPTRSDSAPTGGPPGLGISNTGFNLPNNGQWNIPLGAYPTTQSPWGLLDTSGGTIEYTESVSFALEPQQRIGKGSCAGTIAASSVLDLITAESGTGPTSGFGIFGLRVASSIPAPSTVAVFFSSLAALSSQRRKRS